MRVPDRAQRGKEGQKHRYNSKAHNDSFDRRTQVERGYSNEKMVSGENVVRGAICLMGTTKQGFMVAFAFAAQNIRLLRQWFHRRAKKTLTAWSHRLPTSPIRTFITMMRMAAPWSIHERGP